MEARYNTRSPAVKRLMKEAQELSEPTDQYYAQPLEDNLFEWHFTVRGPADTEFQHGMYHGRIVLPVDYPMKPPSIIWLTPNGRFETNKKICLSISGHHPESWQPSWSIRTALLAIIGFMPTHGGGAIGSLDYTPEERKVLAKRSRDWKCPSCGDVQNILLEPSVTTTTGPSEEAKKLAAQINFQGEKPKNHCSTECLAQSKAQDASVSGATTAPKITATAPEGSSQMPQPAASLAPVNFSNMFSPIHSWRMPPVAPGHQPTADLGSEWEEDTSEDNQFNDTSEDEQLLLPIEIMKENKSSILEISNFVGKSTLNRIKNCSSMPELKILRKRIKSKALHYQTLHYRKSEPSVICSVSETSRRMSPRAGHMIEAHAGDTRSSPRRIQRRRIRHHNNHTGSLISLLVVIVLLLAFASMGLATIVSYLFDGKNDIASKATGTVS